MKGIVQEIDERIDGLTDTIGTINKRIEWLKAMKELARRSASTFQLGQTLVMPALTLGGKRYRYFKLHPQSFSLEGCDESGCVDQLTEGYICRESYSLLCIFHALEARLKDLV